jgi:hypothetical protein
LVCPFYPHILTAELLETLIKYIPRRVLSNTGRTVENPVPVPIATMFRGRKADIIELLTFLSHENKEVQDIVRENGGLALVISQQAIDDDNPCMS